MAAAVVFAWLWWRARWRLQRRMRTRQRRAKQGETASRRLLEAAGFRIVASQPTVSWWMEVDDDWIEVQSRADWLVEAHATTIARRGARFIAEVKTGSLAPVPTRPATRRQLLEYLYAFDVAGVLLVDMESQQVRTIRFDIDGDGPVR